jgi:hypothetical protein
VKNELARGTTPKRLAPFLVVALLAFGVVACEEKPAYSGDERILPFDSADVRLTSTRDTAIVRIDLAVSHEQNARIDGTPPIA